MIREPGNSPPEINKKDTGTKTEVRRYKLITPLYGGGVGDNEADPVTVVRGTEIRGHLRFWWRATQGGRYSTIDEMRKAEGKIWGSTENESDVVISIQTSPDRVQYEPAFEVVSEMVRGER
ncbi:MAG: type III-B CRISPR module RAMP protein Cmr1, partial [Chloroflexota bacterium]|nr:type III-B CRISPR module RAMP protein Cmr1 [Chloroflexota bacterium]